VTNKVDAAGTEILRYQYDADSRLTNRWSGAKCTTTYRYNAAGSLTNVIYPVSPSLAFTYDALERLTNMVDAVGTTAYNYDSAGQVLMEDGPWTSAKKE
jgi:YD repeat-containing protein